MKNKMKQMYVEKEFCYFSVMKMKKCFSPAPQLFYSNNIISNLSLGRREAFLNKILRIVMISEVIVTSKLCSQIKNVHKVITALLCFVVQRG